MDETLKPDDSPMVCYRHPRAETFLRCQKCERPICTSCSKVTPVGARCPECATSRSSPLFQVGADRLVIGGLVGMAAAFLVSYVLLFLSGMGFLLLFGGVAGGSAVGEAILRVIQRKRGPRVEVLTGVSATAGAILATAVWYASRGGPNQAMGLAELVADLQHRPFFVVAAGLMVFGALSKVKFF